MNTIHILTPIKSIRAKCLDCCCNQTSQVRTCQIVKCSLHPYRMGCRPEKVADIEKRGSEAKPASSEGVFCAGEAISEVMTQ